MSGYERSLFLFRNESSSRHRSIMCLHEQVVCVVDKGVLHIAEGYSKQLLATPPCRRLTFATSLISHHHVVRSCWTSSDVQSV